MLTIGMPDGFPHPTTRTTERQALSKALVSLIDYRGFFLLLSACAFLVVALEETGIRYAWSDPIPISFLVLSGLLWIVFFSWEYVVSGEGRSQEPVFSWSFLRNRVFLGVLLYVPNFPEKPSPSKFNHALTHLKRRFTLRASALRDDNPDPATLPNRQLPFIPLLRPSHASFYPLYPVQHRLCQHVGIQAEGPADIFTRARLRLADNRHGLNEYITSAGRGEDVWI